MALDTPEAPASEVSVKFGICVMANIDEIGFFTHAENLGYDSVWVTDSQMLFSDCYAVLALAARAHPLRGGVAALWVRSSTLG